MLEILFFRGGGANKFFAQFLFYCNEFLSVYKNCFLIEFFSHDKDLLFIQYMKVQVFECYAEKMLPRVPLMGIVYLLHVFEYAI